MLLIENIPLYKQPRNVLHNAFLWHVLTTCTVGQAPLFACLRSISRDIRMWAVTLALPICVDNNTDNVSIV